VIRGDEFWDGDVGYTPVMFDDGRVGYYVRDERGDDPAHTTIYFNPSINDGDDDPNVFVYMGPGGDPTYDTPQVYVLVEFPDEDGKVPQAVQDLARIANNIEDEQRRAAQDDPRGERDR
jgi:hypothetical protein